jgi:hypothetical protein
MFVVSFPDQVWLRELVNLACDSRPIPIISNKDKQYLTQALSEFLDMNRMLSLSIISQRQASGVAIDSIVAADA